MQAMQLGSSSLGGAGRRSSAGNFAAALARITLLAVLVAVPLGLTAFQFYGTAGVTAAVIAVAACHLGAVAALAYGKTARAFGAHPFHILAAMGFRFLLPIAACAVAAAGQSWVMQAGFAYWILAAYPVLLAGQVWFDVRRREGGNGGLPSSTQATGGQATSATPGQATSARS